MYGVYSRGYAFLLLFFSVGYLDWNKGTASILVSVFYLVGTFGRMINICIVRYAKVEILLFTYTVLCVIGYVLLTLLIDVSDIVLWVGTVYISLAECAIIGLVTSWTDKYLGLVGWAAVSATVGRMGGEVIAPVLLTPLMTNVSYKYFLYVTTTAAIISLVSIFPMQYFGMKYKGKHTNAQT
jgi:hypothetical protein